MAAKKSLLVISFLGLGKAHDSTCSEQHRVSAVPRLSVARSLAEQSQQRK